MAFENAPQMRAAARWVLGVALVAGLASCDSILSPGTPLSFVTVDVGGSHTCGLRPDGHMYCWGQGGTGELGHGVAESSARPVKVGGGHYLFESIALGQRHTCATTEAGVAYCWGWNPYGQLGTGSTVGLGSPAEVEGDHRFAKLAAGLFHTCGITIGGEAYCWGGNGQGQLGNPVKDQSLVPVAVAGELTFTDVSAGSYHTCGVAADRRAYCWGLNFLGQLGVGDTQSRAEPALVAGALEFSAVTAGFTHSCGITTEGRGYCWGGSAHGEVGNGLVMPYGMVGATTPHPIHEPGQPLRFTSLSAGRHVTCGTDIGRDVWCWGAGFQGQLGINQLADWAVPRRVLRTFDLRFTMVSTGLGTHVCGATWEHGAYCWGTSEEGGLGPGATMATHPVRVYGR
jgi:alpha-tubulin suppressor-like RCC1 family protein